MYMYLSATGLPLAVMPKAPARCLGAHGSHHGPTCPPLPLQPSRSNFPDDVLDEPQPPLPRCARCDRAIDTACEGHSFSSEGLMCTPCAMRR